MVPVLTILIAECHAVMFDVLNEHLSETNCVLLQARDGVEAMGLLERLKSKIDVVLVDLELPHFSGWDLVIRLKAHQRSPIKIIATTSIYTPALLEKMKKLGVDGVVVRTPVPNCEWRTILLKAVMPLESARAVGAA